MAASSILSPRSRPRTTSNSAVTSILRLWNRNAWQVMVSTFLLAAATVVASVEGSIWDKKLDDLSRADKFEYAKEVSLASGGMGLGVAFVLFTVNLMATFILACRCNRLLKADLAIANLEDDGDVGGGPDDMYEVEDYEDQIAKHRKRLWNWTILLCVGFIFCGAFACADARSTDASVMSFFDGTSKFLEDFQEALCAKGGDKDCTEGSLGGFVIDVGDEVKERMDGAVDFLSGLSVMIDPLHWVSDNLTTATEVLEGTRASVVHINASIVDANTVLTGEGSIGEFVGGERMDVVDRSVLDEIETGRDGVLVAKNLTRDSIADFVSHISGEDSTIMHMLFQLDEIDGNEVGSAENIRGDMMDIIYDNVLGEIANFAVDIHDVQTTDLKDAREKVDELLQKFLRALAGLVFLPLVLLFFTTTCSFWTQTPKGIFCCIGGVFLALAKINGDVCEHHMTLIETNLEPYNTTVQGVEIIVSFERVRELLQCDGYPGDAPNGSNNVVDIFGAHQAFNVSDALGMMRNLLEENMGLLTSPKSLATSAQDKLAPLNDFVHMNVSSNANLTRMAKRITDELGKLPSAPFHWSSWQDQHAMDTAYLMNVNEFSWYDNSTGNLTYRSQLDTINSLFGLMTDGVLGGPGFYGFRASYDFDTARNLTGDAVCGVDTNFYPNGSDPLRSENLGIVIYSYQDHFTHLCANVRAYAQSTQLIGELIAENNSTRRDLERVRDNVRRIDGNLSAIAEYQDEMALLRDDMNSSLARLADTLDALVEDLFGLAENVGDLNDIIMGANKYTMCGYIGEFYNKVYLKSTCQDLQKNARALARSCLALACFMVFAFVILGFYGPSLRRRSQVIVRDIEEKPGSKVKGGGDQEEEYLEDELPTPHSASPHMGGQFNTIMEENENDLEQSQKSISDTNSPMPLMQQNSGF